MLYNPDWKKPAEVLSLESLIAWLEKQPADGTYDFMCCGECLLAQYFTSCGFSAVSMGSSTFQLDGIERSLPPIWNAIARGTSITLGRWTFGAAFSRDRAALR